MTTVRVLHVDAFSAGPGMGNPAGVLLDAEGLGEAGAAAEPIVVMAQVPARFVDWGGRHTDLARVLGIAPDDLRPDWPIRYGSTGLWTLVVPVRGLDAIRRMKPRTAEFPAVLAEMPGASIHPFCVETIDHAAQMHARHFSSPRSGTVEDPVTGTASGVLGAYYREHVAPAAPSPLLIEQGREVGRDGRVRVWVERRDGAWHVSVGGAGCVGREMAIEVPDA